MSDAATIEQVRACEQRIAALEEALGEAADALLDAASILWADGSQQNSTWTNESARKARTVLAARWPRDFPCPRCDHHLLVSLDEAKEAIRKWRARAERADRIVSAEKRDVDGRLQEGIDKAVAAMEACQYVDGPPEHEAWRAAWDALAPLATRPKGMTDA